MRAKSVEELLFYQKAVVACDEVSAYLKRSSFRDNRRLHEQLGASSERVGSLISEGFGQDTDRHFASYLEGVPVQSSWLEQGNAESIACRADTWTYHGG